MKYSRFLYPTKRIKAILLSFLALFCVLTAQAQNIIYVSPDGTGDGSSWGTKTNLTDALNKAQAGDEIWLQGYEQITQVSQLYVAPENGWTVPSGVKIFGGFEGKETSIDQRKTLGKAYQMTFRSVLSGDINKDDKIDPNNSIFPENTTRSDNAKHVLVLNAFRDEADNLNDNSNPTVVDGLTIVGGHAADFGGGIYVKGDANTPDNSVPYSIDRCYLLNNYGYKGGAIYVDASVKKVATQSLINQCVVYNNVAGTVIGKENLGGGIYIDGAGNIVNCSVFNNENGGVVLSTDAYLVNTTVARNTGAGVDMTASPSDENAHVYNSVIWGNSFVAAANWPVFSYSAYPDAPAGNNNINLSKNNQGDTTSPRFDAPSLKNSFDIDYDWRRNAYPLWSWKLREGSYLIDKGNNDAYNTYAKGYNGVIGTDLNGTARIVGNIDINAYEFETVPASRIRYVKTDGNDSNDGQSWDKAYASVQKAINDLALSQPGVPGEVWVAAGTYSPKTRLTDDSDSPASFRMYDGISVYGGFAGTESSKEDREKGAMPWIYTNQTIFEGTTYNGENVWNESDYKWTVNSGSVHVVWFAPLPGEEEFTNITVLDGVTIQGGMSNSVESVNYDNTKGAGVYMRGRNVYLNNSIVKDNVSLAEGGGIYLEGGRVQGCLVYNNSSETRGGAIYMDNSGLVLRSMLTNNAALEGGAIYMDNYKLQEDGQNHPEYQILSTSVVSNNTSKYNGAVYCNKGGIILQTTITNNYTPTATDNASSDASQTGGLYINEYAKVINSVLWNNKIIDRPVQLYAKNPTSTNVGFYYCAVANMNNIVWNNTLQSGLISLSEENITNSDNLLDPGFVPAGLPGDVGVDETVKKVSYFWQPIQGSNLRARGMELGRLPQEVLVAPELDIQGALFAQKPAIGAYRVEQTPIEPEKTDSYIRIYVDTECTIAGHNGNSWKTAYRSLNEAIEYMAALTADEVKGKKLEIYVLEGDIWPRYASVNLDPKTATIEVPAMASGQPLTIKGGYSRELKDGTCAPLTYRSQINGNHEGKNIEDGLYHCITVENNAKVEFDGFHIINGYAAGTANLKYGAGMLVREGADVTVKNSIFENNTAVEGAAIDARDAKLTLINCVVNNNTNKTATASVINCTNLIMNHVSVVNNIGAAPASSENVKNSFAVGNSYGDTQNFTVDLSNFANPTKNKGAILGYDTYLGGYSSFLPTNQAPVVNKGTTIGGIDQDIAGSKRVLGGAPDLGAYEANLPAAGEVIYVRQGGTGEGSSWDDATGSIQAAIDKATKEVWVAAGTYNERITLKNDVDVLGGFAKTGNPDNKLDGTNRDISNSNPDFMTIIDGQNGGRVVTQSDNFTNLTTVEGFIIQNGRMSGSDANNNGAGVKLMSNGKLKNCLVQNNTHTNTYDSWRDDPKYIGGGGISMSTGSIVDGCIIKGNKENKENNDRYTCGAGIHMNGGTLINSIVIDNVATSTNGSDWYNWGSNILGAAVFVQNASTFYNCTFAYNYGNTNGKSAVVGGVWDDSKNSKFYNCIFWGNAGNGTGGENTIQVGGPGYSDGGTEAAANKNLINCYASIAESSQTTAELWGNPDATFQMNIGNSDYNQMISKAKANQPFDDNYKLLKNETGLHCINKGENSYVEANNIDLDAAGQRRIQYCTVDKGAYESTNAITIEPDGNGIFYVTQGGAGSSDGSSVSNASCAMELQRVLNAAGELVEKGQTATVKIAGYENGAFKYRANTLSDDADPQSYTFVVPYGVIVEGGYNDQESEWNDANRNPYKYQTVLSALAQGDGQDINGYHVITFGEPGTASGKQTIIDGLYLIEGKATSMAGGNNPNTRGGGAVVPDWAHVRNCVVAQCEAIQGGALYLLPGATVSGTLIMENEAEDGAGVYADAEGAGKALRAHMISNTITDNTASEVGGGIYLEDGAALTTNSVIWGNTAPSDKNVSGVVNSTFEDDKFTQVVGEGAIPEFYPFNHCYVETYEMPSNYENTSMQSDESLYFATDRTLKAYSELVKHGTVNYEDFITVFDVAEKDMQGIARKQNNIDRVDVGAYAFEGGIIPLPKSESDIVKRIFVSQGSNVNLPEENSIDTYIGRSFYTSVSWLDDAIDYIKKVRATYKDVKFEIYLAGGTYKPSNRRTDATTTTIDQRQNSYVIPAGVTIYGGFKGDEKYGYGISSIPIAGQEDPILLVPIEDKNLNTFLEERTYSDLNGNGVKEPWEFENQSILSGNVNVSTTVKNAYHVVFSSAEPETTNTDVILDGVTIKDGETINELSNAVDTDERGRGGAIYTNGVNYVLRGCRVMNCKAIRGGAIYSRDADVTIMGSVIAGNGTVEGELKLNGQDVRGGAVYISAYNEPAKLKAVNTLWANNETTGKGGAIATSNDLGFTGSATVSLMNNTFVRNKASENSAIHATADTVTNSVMWGGEGTGVASESLTFVNCASDGTISGNGCIKLNAQNMALDGPRFAQPSEIAGVAGNNIASKWNPASVSVLTDAGDGQLAYGSDDVTAATGAYSEWFTATGLDGNFYFGDDAYKRYMGPEPLPEEEAQPKVIDMGVYEYQYQTRFAEMDKIYVDTKENGNGSGDSWANATSDLRGAIIALSNPTGGSADKYIYIKGGDYPQSKLYPGEIAYRAVMASDNSYLNSLTIEGSYAENTQQDFSKPTRILPSTVGSGVNTLMYVKTSGKKLTVKGIEFSGSKVAGLQIDNTGEVTLKNVAFRNNAADGAVLSGSGKVLVANALFADGDTGLKADGSDVTVVNATFANNKTAGINGTVKLYNSVAWNSGNEITDNSAEGNINLHNVANNDVLNGPNFVNPEQGNYMIRPSIKLLDLANNDRYTTLVGALGGDKDLANNNRLTGDRLDIGAYEYNAQLQPVVYVKAGVVNSDGSGSSWENPISDLQSAVDLASIYANKNDQETAYVFVHKNVKSENIRQTMPRVKVYGGMNDEVAADASSLIKARTSVLADNMSTINGLTLAGESSVIDGFAVTGTVNVNGGMLSTSVVNGDATVGADGVVYNSYVSGTLSGAGKAVNVTSPKQVSVSDVNKINVVENAQPNGYVNADIWKYQLKEDNSAIDAAVESIADYIALVGHSKDLSGSPRVRNTVDNGCFETWNITSNTTLTATERPTENHVVYVRKGVEADIAEGLYPDGTKFNVGFLLLEHGAGLRSNGNAIKLTNFAVERNLDESNNRWDMCYMPFDIIRAEGTDDVAVKTYNGEKRAAYDYQFSATDGAWDDTGLQGGKGLLLQSTADAKVRMYGNSYTEAAGQSGQVQLAKYNNMQPWNSENSGTSQKFTHLENMSWNMFGSPFLCAMNYDDMEYGRVIYKKGGNTYTSENTAEANDGFIEAGSAVFTQTATLQTVEEFNVNQRTSALSETGTRTRLAVAVAPQGQGEQDELTLTAVPTEEASDQFNMAADGVKMMTVGKAAQIYLERGGKHYSMLTALDLEGKIDVGVLAPESGMYSIFIPEDCPMDEYETVVLEDKTNGRMVDLLEGGYDFQMNEAGTLNSRFTLSFNRELAEQGLTRIRIQAMGNGQVRITGLMDGDQITAYQENGTMTYSQRVASAEKNIALPGKVCLIKVVAADGSEIVKKLVIR